MKTYKSILFLLSLVFISTACKNDSSNCPTGSGSNISRDYTVTDLNALSMYGSVEVIVTKDSVSRLRIEAQENVLNTLNVEVTNGELTIGRNNCFGNINRPKVFVSMASFVRLKSFGSIELMSNDTFTETSFASNLSGTDMITVNMDVENFQCTVSGTSSIVAKGIAKNQFIQTTGDLDFRGFELLGENVNIDVSGIGNLEVNASQTLDVKITGTATVHYKGNPTITSDIVGTGNIIDAN